MYESLFESNIPSLRLRHRGKVRDIYDIDARHMLIVTSDRLSAFDVVLPTPIPGKGEILTAISNFWFRRLRGVIPNHLAALPLQDVLPAVEDRRALESRSVVVRKLRALPVEAVVRGYLIGSGWKDYQREGTIGGIRLAPGLRLAERLPEPIFTPSTKAGAGEHDVNIGFEQVAELVGRELAIRVRETSLELYRQAAAFARDRGIIIADTKFEFGLGADGALVLIDEALTPDSSRFWPADTYRPGSSPPSFDKQFVRDYLETLDWDKTAPGPALPRRIVDKTAEKYRTAKRLLMGE
ncbi:MAG: phosphoribosylaminoimidazolesuccinocarboxamide synthase [Gammaproteobacteria bacterium]